VEHGIPTKNIGQPRALMHPRFWLNRQQIAQLKG
jgi:hypothetical protein